MLDLSVVDLGKIVSMNRVSVHAFRVGLLLSLAVAVGACEQIRGVTGATKQAPDEFRVVSRAPLSLPPEYDLRPPRPGAARPQEGSVPAQAKSAVLAASPAQATVPAQSASAAEAALLRAAGAVDVPADIRQTIDRESAFLIESDRSFTDRLVFWRKADLSGQVIDAEKEARRLREAQALGKPVDGRDVPIIERRQRGLLEGIF